jgi:MarR family protease production transcriptional regulator HPr
MRNTYIQLTEKGEELVLTIFKNYEPLQNPVFREALALQHLYGKFPDFIEMMAIVRSIYGDDFMGIVEYSFDNIEKVSPQEN